MMWRAKQAVGEEYTTTTLVGGFVNTLTRNVVAVQVKWSLYFVGLDGVLRPYHHEEEASVGMNPGNFLRVTMNISRPATCQLSGYRAVIIDDTGETHDMVVEVVER